MEILDAELNSFNTDASAGLFIGSSTSGSITVNGITAANTDQFATVTLIATGPSKTITFGGSDSTFGRGIVVFAGDGVIVSSNLATTTNPTILNSGAGTLTVSAGKTINSGSQELTLSVGDLDLTGAVNTGTASLVIDCAVADTTVGLGSGAGQLSVSGSELQQVTSNGMRVGGNVPHNCANQAVNEVLLAHTVGISNVVSLLAERDDAKVLFEGSYSTFKTLHVKADNGIVLGINYTLSTDETDLYLDGDSEDSSTGDRLNIVELSHGSTLHAREKITLESTTGNPGADGILATGEVTLRSGSGVTLSNKLGYGGGWLDMMKFTSGSLSLKDGSGVGGTADLPEWRSEHDSNLSQIRGILDTELPILS